MKVLSVEALKRERESWLLLDVREPDEIVVAALDHDLAIPLGELPTRIVEIPRAEPVAVLCHHGVRSLRAAKFLVARGYDAASVDGGIEAWSVGVDPAVPRY